MWSLHINAGYSDRCQDHLSPRTVAIPSTLPVGPRYNIAPTQDVIAVINNGSLHLDMLRWGLIPSWSKEENVGSRMINARAETLAEKPSFKRLLHSKRCLVVTDGFYEWRQESGPKSAQNLKHLCILH